ncbi:peptidase M23 [Coxiella burnetii]|uniref:Non-proteolytic protein, peptidase family M23 n=1 Tax=Coxiella burnetii (strain Dugway 5J108-111) TaxID=434922 RepID=A9KF69_COXBN|nr:peptidoglycan DD-metalloendopeptidase family protein [Coxiella burnetii]ABS78465.2 non-proteolytic protein, peptidase family M23 [Coxiella burnetii Dugway 5J108-111]OYK80783.1 peptidase M23 [Coxiella burnetii]OYK82871.1 peptidase M23 [Coxiella burnetii]
MQRILRFLLLFSIAWIVFPFVFPFLHGSSSRGLSAGPRETTNDGMTVSMMILPEAFAATPTDLKQINHKIETLKAALSKEKNKRTFFLKRLKTAEIASGRIRLQLQKTEAALKKESQLLEKLNHDQTTYQAKLATERAELADHLRAAYMIGREPYLKLILSQNDAQRVSHLLMYYHYLSKGQLSAIHDLQSTLARLRQNQTSVQAQTHILQNLQKQQSDERAHLEALKQERQQAIGELNNKIKTKNQRLAELLADKRLLEQTLSRLEKQHQIEAIMKQDFAALKGKLSWPTKGSVLPYFGIPIDQSELKWDGILIRAPEDQPVYAVAGGKVVFAKWLPGYGLLLIISHGHGYMTLYGRNHNLYKKPGDMVQKGDLVATVGRSGGYEKPALYFAIRHDAKPLNPSMWCHRGENQ